ncbi:MAG: hypothetical protein DWQ28_06685 [Proteobacteria bacterium]|nr:MAG: hypothetical protein DWQ28_06380 [Pseudomonadota bacterium]REJ67718.1 MAG: hypothetical protein DWQ28_06685 [Pseudomonadota bacterium]
MSKAAELAALIGSQSALSNRNLIINGAMQVAQRGTSTTGLSDVAGIHTADRWRFHTNTSGTFTVSQSTEAPSGFSNSYKVDCTTADSSPNYVNFSQRIEGQNLQHLKKGTSDAVATTLSFYVRSSKTGTYQVSILDEDNTRMVGKTYTINAADTWEYKTLTFPGDTSGALDNDNGNSLQIEWWLAAGSTYKGGAVPTAWEAKDNTDRAAGLTVNIGASTSDDWYITGIQYEVGEQGTAFEHRSYSDELQRCQRYFFKYQCKGFTMYFDQVADSATNEYAQGGISFPVEMRAKPTSSASGTISKANLEGGGPNQMSVFSLSDAGFVSRSSSTGRFYCYTNDGFTNSFDAEL